MLEHLTDRARRWAAFALAGGVVLVDSASRILSMCADLVIVALLLCVLMLGNPSRRKKEAPQPKPTRRPTNGPSSDNPLLNPLHPLNPANPIYAASDDNCRRRSHEPVSSSHCSSSNLSSSDSSSSSSSDSGSSCSSSCD